MLSPLAWLRERFAAPPAASLTRIVSTWLEGRDLPAQTDLARLGDEGYRKSMVIFACIREIAASAAEPILRVYAGEDPSTHEPIADPADPLLALLTGPNDEQSAYEFVEELVTHLYVAGNAYIHKVRALRASRVVRLFLLRPDRVSIRPGAGGVVESYGLRIDGKDQPPLPAGDVIHIKFPDPLDDYYGLSPLAVAARVADLDLQAVDFLRAIFLNRGIPAGILKLQSRVEPKERERLKLLWEDEYAGFRGWHRLAVLDGGAEYQDIGMKLDELNLDGVLSQTETRICAVFGVPPIKIGVKAGLAASTYSNYEQADRSYWLETLSPLYRRLGDKLTLGLGAEYGNPRRRVAFDLSQVPALQEDQKALRQFALDAWDKGLLKRNEARKLVKQPEDPGGDVYKSETRPAPPLALPVNGDGNGNGNGQPALADAAGRLMLPERFAIGVTEPADDPEWKLLHRIADSGYRTIRTAVLDAVELTREAVDLDALEAALANRDEPSALLLIPWEREGGSHLERTLTPETERLFAAAGEAAQDYLMRALTIEEEGEGFALDVELRFDVLNPRAVAWIQDRTANLVREINTNQRLAIRDIISRSFTEGYTPRRSAQQIRNVVGLTRRQSAAVFNYQRKLVREGVPFGEAQAKAEKYSQKLLRQRADTIAQTETIAASAGGQHELWRQARDEGFLQEDRTRRVWIVTPDDHLDAVQCAPMPELNADGVGIDEPFRTGDGGTVMAPPVHPR